MAQNPFLAVDFWTDPRRRIWELERAWEGYLAGNGSLDALRPVIVESWDRCRRYGVDPRNARTSVHMDDREVAGYWRESLLARELQPILSDLTALVPESGHLVVVADQNGLLMHVHGDVQTRTRAEKMNFAPGALWSESAAGTNAIGMALAAGTAMQVLGAEHLVETVHPWTCSAAPITDPTTGEVLGVIDVTGVREAVHPHSLMTVLTVARAVEARLRESRKVLELRVEGEYMKERAQAGESPLAAVDAGGRLLIASPALTGLGVIDGHHRITVVQSRMLAEAADRECQWEVEGRRGERLNVFARPVHSEGRLAGYIVRVWSPVKRKPTDPAASVRYSFGSVLGRSPKLLEVLKRARLVAAHSLPVLLTGESGTGKEVVAQSIHEASPRRAGPFVAVNCAAIPGELLASELFGYDRGAFTGARREGYPGKFEQAAGGTLFLDEIGDMPAASQAHLLRVLEEKAVVRLGGFKPIPVDVRIIAATNAHLEQRVQEGQFRGDLYYRIAAWRIPLAPLRERAEDIGTLLQAFLTTLRGELGRPFIQQVSPAALALLEAYPWPGNIRELRNVAMEMALEAAGPVLQLEDVPTRIREHADRPEAQARPSQLAAGATASAPVAPGEAPEHLLQRALQETGGNVTEAARRLGIHRSTLYRRLGRKAP